MDPLILFIIVGSIAGFLLGAVVGLFIARRGQNRKAEEESASSEKVVPEAGQPLIEPPAPLTKRTLEDYQPLICLWRGRKSGGLAIEIKGKLYPTIDDFDLNAKTHLLRLNQEWMAWLGLSADHSQIMEPKLTPQEKATLLEEDKKPKPAVTPPPTSEPAFTTKKEEIAGTEMDELRSKTMVEQIDEILQEKLSTSPHANQSIRIMEDPDKGVVVWIGLKHYSGIDEVDDPEVLKIIRAAVADWEARTQGKRR